MTREQARTFLKLSKDDLEKINCGYAKHYEILKSFAYGDVVEGLVEEPDKWKELDDPTFNFQFKYRVKPSAEQPAETWKPEIGEEFFIVNDRGELCSKKFCGLLLDFKLTNFGNCFRTRAKAEAALERVRAALKGETVSKTENVESLDGHELSDAEKGVIRILRRCKVETMWNGPFVYLERQKTLTTCNAGVLFKFELGSKASEFGDVADDVIAEAEERREKGEPSW